MTRNHGNVTQFFRLQYYLYFVNQFPGFYMKTIFIPDDGGSTYLWNVGRQSFYTAVQPRRQLWTSCVRLSINCSCWTPDVISCLQDRAIVHIVTPCSLVKIINVSEVLPASIIRAKMAVSSFETSVIFYQATSRSVSTPWELENSPLVCVLSLCWETEFHTHRKKSVF
jgi:hypothetical protein